MKKYWLCILLFAVFYSSSQSQNRLPFKKNLLIYSITNDVFKNAIDSFFINPQGLYITETCKSTNESMMKKINKIEKVNKIKHIFCIYIELETDSTYRFNFELVKRSLVYSGIYMYQHTYIQQFFILYKNYYILTFFENDKYPRYETNDMSIIKFPFLHLMDKTKSMWMKKAPKNYYDTNYQGEEFSDKSIAFGFYQYKNGKFGEYKLYDTLQNSTSN